MDPSAPRSRRAKPTGKPRMDGIRDIEPGRKDSAIVRRATELVVTILEASVRSRIHRGRSQLREALAHRAPRSGTATRMPVAAAASTEAPAEVRAEVIGQVAP